MSVMKFLNTKRNERRKVMNQRLKCYRILVDVAKAMPRVIGCIPRGEGNIKNQLKRASSSSILNLAEGNGRFSRYERNRFFNYSLGSISEMEGCLDWASAFGYIKSDLANPILADLRKAYNMIRKLKK